MKETQSVHSVRSHAKHGNEVVKWAAPSGCYSWVRIARRFKSHPAGATHFLRGEHKDIWIGRGRLGTHILLG